MKTISKSSVLTALCALGGFLCLLMRQWLLSSGIDEMGLVVTGHPGNVICWLLTAAAAVCLILAARRRPLCRFAPSPLSALTCLISAVGLAFAVPELLRMGHFPAVAAAVLAVVSAACAIAIALSTWTQKRLHPLVFCPIVVFFMVFLLSRYSQWSGESELQQYFFPLTAGVCLLLSVYHRAALAEGKKPGRAYLLLSRGAVFLSLAAVPGDRFGLLYGCMAVALMLDGCIQCTPEEETAYEEYLKKQKEEAKQKEEQEKAEKAAKKAAKKAEQENSGEIEN